jgi:hypothetical protein
VATILSTESLTLFSASIPVNTGLFSSVDEALAVCWTATMNSPPGTLMTEAPSHDGICGKSSGIISRILYSPPVDLTVRNFSPVSIWIVPAVRLFTMSPSSLPDTTVEPLSEISASSSARTLISRSVLLMVSLPPSAFINKPDRIGIVTLLETPLRAV